jgi:hypothetical protein
LLALKACLLTKEAGAKLPPTHVHPVTNGIEFEAVAPFLPVMSMAVAFELMKVTGNAEIDPRFFGSRTTSRGKPGAASGRAKAARRAPASAGTADSSEPTAGS